MDSIASPAKTRHRQEPLESALTDLEQRFAQLQSQIHRLQGLATLGTLSAAMAHEINNLLTPISGRCQFALRSDNPKLSRDALEGAVRGAHQIAEVCDRILAVARAESASPSSVPVAEVLDDAIACLGRDPAKDGIELQINVDSNLCARCCSASLRQVLLNLILNARQAMSPNGGRLTIRAGIDAGASSVFMEIADTGCGIAPEDLGRVFDPYFTTRSSSSSDGGTGLGLYVSRQLVAQMGGRITVESRQGQGATFRITLPRGNDD